MGAVEDLVVSIVKTVECVEDIQWFCVCGNISIEKHEDYNVARLIIFIDMQK